MTAFLRAFSPLAVILFFFSSCTEEYSPKPKGYFRIDLPPKKYQQLVSACPFTFEFHKMAIVKHDKEKDTEPCWLNIEYPRQNATIHISYKKIADTLHTGITGAKAVTAGNNMPQSKLNEYIEDSRLLVYKHTVKATDIVESRISDDSSQVYGLLYTLEGNTASSMQFYLTDSLGHFIRGALYFNVAANADSLSPVIRYLQDDILHLVNTFEWK